MANNVAFEEIDRDIRGVVTANSVISRSASLTNAMFSPNTADRLAAAKSIHARSIEFRSIAGAAVGTATWPLASLVGATTIISIKAFLEVACTGGDTVTVDIKKSTAGGAWATILTSVLTLAAADPAARTLKTASLLTSALAANDLLQIVVTVTGTTAQGLCVTIEHHMNPS